MAPNCPDRSAAPWSTSFFGRRFGMRFTSCPASREEKQRVTPADPFTAEREIAMGLGE